MKLLLQFSPLIHKRSHADTRSEEKFNIFLGIIRLSFVGASVISNLNFLSKSKVPMDMIHNTLNSFLCNSLYIFCQCSRHNCNDMREQNYQGEHVPDPCTLLVHPQSHHHALGYIGMK